MWVYKTLTDSTYEMLPLISIYQLKTLKTRNKNPGGRLPPEKDRDDCRKL